MDTLNGVTEFGCGKARAQTSRVISPVRPVRARVSRTSQPHQRPAEQRARHSAQDAGRATRTSTTTRTGIATNTAGGSVPQQVRRRARSPSASGVDHAPFEHVVRQQQAHHLVHVFGKTTRLHSLRCGPPASDGAHLVDLHRSRPDLEHQPS